MTWKATEIDIPAAVHLPMSERVLDRLADILLATDEILDMMKTDEHLRFAGALEVEESVRSVYDQVNDLMQKYSD